MRIHLGYLVVLILMLGCSKEKNDCMKSTGEIIFVDRELALFSEIEINNNVNVILTQDTFSSIMVEAGENLIEKITTVVQGDRLVIQNENKCNWVRSYDYAVNVHVSVTNLQRIEHNGYGKISSTNTIQSDGIVISINANGDVELDINMPYCFSDMHKSGDLILSGYARLNGLWASGNNWIRCKDLKTDTTFIESGTTGDSYVNASLRLQALVKGPGDIFYSGSPIDVVTEITGEGAVIKN